MEYFVSAEDTSYHHWQLEFLIESFKLHKLQDKLVIAVASNNEEKLVDFSANLKTCQRIFMHDNIGRKRGYLPWPTDHLKYRRHFRRYCCAGVTVKSS